MSQEILGKLQRVTGVGMPKSTRLCLAVVLVASAFGVVVGSAEDAQAGNFVSEGDYDFDCDGVRDLVSASDWASVDGVEHAGQVAVTYSRTGTEQIVSQATLGVPGAPEKEDYFGRTHTAYDRNQDGCDELVIGVPYEDVGLLRNAGTVALIPGSATGLDTLRSEGYTQNTTGISGVAEELDWFGWSLAGGSTNRGTPYLLIGAPGEGRLGAGNHGVVYYLRSGSVTVIHQDSPGVVGIREDGDVFGMTLAVSDRYFVVAAPEESINGDVGDGPEAGSEGMIHVFSHTLTSGRPTPVGAFHQDTYGISGKAEWKDGFGHSVSVVPYRPAGSTSVGALVAVGSNAERVNGDFAAGMAHLVYVSPSGSVRQLAAITQSTPGVTGTPEAGDELGGDVVVASMNPENTIAEPHTAVWGVAVSNEKTSDGNTGAAHVLRATWQPGSSDIWLEEGRYGIIPDKIFGIDRLRASATYLHLGSGWCVAVPWQNMFGTVSQPVVPRGDDCR